MATIDIREDSSEIDTIKFSDTGNQANVVSNTPGSWIEVSYEHGSYSIGVEKKDIDNLILALKKAKELWGGYGSTDR